MKRMVNWKLNTCKTVTLFLLLCVGSVNAQTRKPYTPPTIPRDTSTFLFFKDLTAGPYFTGGFSQQNQNLPPEWHSSQRFAYSIGALFDGTITNWLGMGLSLLYDSRDAYLGNPGDSDNIDLNIGYISVQPSIRIFWLMVGLAFEIPMSGSATEIVNGYQHPDQPVQNYSSNMNVETSDLATVTELRGTLSIPILKTESGVVHAVVCGSYPLGKFVSSTTSIDTTIDARGYKHFSDKFAPGQGPLPSIQAGITFQFDILH